MPRIIDPIKLTGDLVRIESINPPGEIACIELIEDLLQGAGFRTVVHSFADRRANLVATLGADSERPCLCLSGHVDTVPLGEEAWKYDPFGAQIENGRIYGRGTSDMKAGVAAIVAAACSMSEQFAARGRLSLIMTAGEETGCTGAKALVANGTRLVGDALIIAEPTSNAPVIGQKGAVWFKAVLHGIAAHGSAPQEGKNAAYAAADLIREVRSLRLDVRHAHFDAPTVNIGSVHAGENVNSVPARAEVTIDFRTVPGLTSAQLRELMLPNVESENDLLTLLSLDSVWSDPSCPWVREVCKIAGKIAGESRWRTASYFTDAAILSPALGAPPTIIIGPGEPTMAHKTDEYCNLDRILESVEIYKTIMLSWIENESSRPQGARR